ncbi:MAG: UTP--glucose-1-phosphate uridylyltransferase [Bacteroidia bacterium]|nr:UTP--glucose-1-phosphate uridylyltransferase [Bacteroidia bacterium]
MPQLPGDFDTTFLPFQTKMEAAGMPTLLIEAFRRNLVQLVSGASVTLGREQLAELADVPDADTLNGYAATGAEALKHTVLIKLNGGLGTSMGLDKAKSLIRVRDGLRFIDIIARQVLKLRERANSAIPLLLLDSATTQADSVAALAEWAIQRDDLPASLLQHRVPKVVASSLAPAEWPEQPALEWCPPGHGDLYLALETSGLLDELLSRGYRYAFVSNADNLGAVMDTSILGYFAEEKIDFLMEVADRTPADRKGGHLAKLKDGRLTLRELAQCPENEAEEFQNITLYRYFNTNSIWLHLPALRALIDRYAGILPLPLIRNRKNLDPRDPASPIVYQLETAMGAAISLFDRASALRVSRTRFAPVKTTDDLLAVRSDAMMLDEQFRIVPNPARTLPPLHVSLDPKHYHFVGQLDEHFPYGAPSLLNCASLRIDGDVRFGRDVTLRGDVYLAADAGGPRTISDNTVLEG